MSMGDSLKENNQPHVESKKAGDVFATITMTGHINLIMHESDKKGSSERLLTGTDRTTLPLICEEKLPEKIVVDTLKREAEAINMLAQSLEKDDKSFSLLEWPPAKID